MSKKMKVPSIFKTKLLEPNHPWQWPASCKNNPKTLSFRASYDQHMFKTVNSVFLDPIETSEYSLFTNTTWECASFSSTDDFSDENCINWPGAGSDDELLETIIQGARLSSERLFFEPRETSSIVKLDHAHDDQAVILPFKESIALALESDDPYLDFKKSMQEMVETQGLMKDDWGFLEQLLGWYLKMNVKVNHGYIVGAFIDLLVGLASSSASTVTNMPCNNSDSTSYSSAASSFSSSSSSTYPSVDQERGIDE